MTEGIPSPDESVETPLSHRVDYELLASGQVYVRNKHFPSIHCPLKDATCDKELADTRGDFDGRTVALVHMDQETQTSEILARAIPAVDGQFMLETEIGGESSRVRDQICIACRRLAREKLLKSASIR